MQKRWIIGIILGISLIFWCCGDENEGAIVKINKAYLMEHVLEVQGNTQLIDVRTAEEYEAGHIGNALNFNIVQQQQFLDQIKVLNKEEPVYLYCKMGGRSNRAAQLLKQKGFLQIFDYSGGYNDWVRDQ